MNNDGRYIKFEILIGSVKYILTRFIETESELTGIINFIKTKSKYQEYI